MSIKHGELLREYARKNSAVFHKTNDLWGGFSNMSSDFPLLVNDISIRSSEALYQACRFPEYPDIQKKIISQTSPMTAKMVAKPYRDKTRKDWETVKILIMKWCVRVKLIQNWNKFGELLLRSGDSPIVEFSKRDVFWGAKPLDEEYLLGVNALGRILMEVRENVVKLKTKPEAIPPLPIPNFLLFGEQIRAVEPLETSKKDDAQQDFSY